MTVQLPDGETTKTGQQYHHLTNVVSDTSDGMLIGGSGSIKIGKGVTAVLVSFTIFSWSKANAYAWHGCELLRDGKKYKEISNAIETPNSSYKYSSCTSCDVLTNVQEGDEIWLKKYETSEEVIRGGVASNLTVKIAKVGH